VGVPKRNGFFWLKLFLAIVVTLVWSASFIADIAMESYDPSPLIHLAMMAILGAVFGLQIKRKADNGA
jgi:hypothetical protein